MDLSTRASRKHQVPLLKIETDFTSQSAGQLLTRIQAFSETIEGSKDMDPGKGISEEAREKMTSGVYYVAGIDSGSTSTDVVILDQDGKIKSTMIIPTGGGATMSAEKSLELAVEKAGIKRKRSSALIRQDTDVPTSTVVTTASRRSPAMRKAPII